MRTSLKTKDGALLIPQRAVTEMQGTYQVAVVDGQNKISIRNVKTSDRVGNRLDHRRRIEAGRTRGRRGRAEGSCRAWSVNPKPYTSGPAETAGK